MNPLQMGKILLLDVTRYLSECDVFLGHCCYGKKPEGRVLTHSQGSYVRSCANMT